MSSIDFTSFLKLMAHKKASDLFITAGVPPSIKVQGKVSHITQSPLTPQQSREMVLNVMSPSQREEFEKTHECNFAIGAAGAANHAASVSSPARVRAIESSSKSEPRPNRSRSLAYK